MRRLVLVLALMVAAGCAHRAVVRQPPASSNEANLVKQGDGLMARDPEAALKLFQDALAADPSLMTQLSQRIATAQLYTVQRLLTAAHGAVEKDQFDAAHASLQHALTVSPDSPLVLRELGLVERRQGDIAAALTHFRQAVSLDPTDATSFVQTGELLELSLDFAGAEAAYRAAATLEPSGDLNARIAALAVRSRDARLPPQFQAIASARQITRGDLAAIIGIRLDDVVRGIPGREEVLTDVRGHWAALWITQVARAEVIEPFDNHTFQPATPLRRVDLAVAVARVVMRLAATHPDLRARLAQRPAIADVSPTYVNSAQIAAAVAAGVLPLAAGRFEPTRAVSGGEALDAVARLRALADAR